MSVPDAGKITEPLRTRFDAATFFPVIVELAIGDDAGGNASLDATYQTAPYLRLSLPAPCKA